MKEGCPRLCSLKRELMPGTRRPSEEFNPKVIRGYGRLLLALHLQLPYHYLIPIALLATNQNLPNSARGHVHPAPIKTAQPCKSPWDKALLGVGTLSLTPFVSRAIRPAPPGFM